MTKRIIKVGSRQSQLAMWQTKYVVEILKNKCPEYNFEIIPIKTKGDKILDVALAKIGDKGLFTKELEMAILSGRIDFAVHSMKDLPTVIPEGLMIAAMTRRHDPRDALISNKHRSFSELPQGAKIGTSSLRRKAQLLNKRPDLKLVDIRGNINTRLHKMDTENLDGIILASAGVERLGWQDKIAEKLDFSICLPAVGQGSIGIEIRSDNEEIYQIVRLTNDLDTEASILAERALLKSLEGGCQIPIGALAEIKDDKLSLQALVGSLNGEIIIRDSLTGDIKDSEKIGIELALKLKEKGANKILQEIRQEIDI
ncbi:MAG: hydroxymethylbilane synthase [Clostridia bacterium]|jgi:hydroxymethylbilane synthase|nr:hydroxymethylbilane synthase [Clostridia bacterium]